MSHWATVSSDLCLFNPFGSLYISLPTLCSQAHPQFSVYPWHCHMQNGSRPEEGKSAGSSLSVHLTCFARASSHASVAVTTTLFLSPAQISTHSMISITPSPSNPNTGKKSLCSLHHLNIYKYTDGLWPIRAGQRDRSCNKIVHNYYT